MWNDVWNVAAAPTALELRVTGMLYYVQIIQSREKAEAVRVAYSYRLPFATLVVVRRKTSSASACQCNLAGVGSARLAERHRTISYQILSTHPGKSLSMLHC